jgi:polysaccharide export outer membrane protein
MTVRMNIRSFALHTVAAGLFLAVSPAVSVLHGQQPPAAQLPPTAVPAQPPAAPSSAPSSADPLQAFRPTYVLGPGDQVIIRASAVEEIGERPYRIDNDGFLTLPLVGKIKAGELSVSQFEAVLIEKLKAYIRNPLVVVTVVQYRSDPVFFMGAFRAPGIYAIDGRRTLVEMLTRTGGLAPNASRRLKVTRRKEVGDLPLASAIESSDGKTVSAEIAMSRLWTDVNPAEDILLKPFDVVSVERAEQIYITGEVAKIGAIELGERDFIPVSQMVILSGGLKPEASPKRAIILRPILNSQQHAEIPVNVEAILRGQGVDLPLLPNDILVIPGRRGPQIALGRMAPFIIPTLISSAMFALIPRN